MLLVECGPWLSSCLSRTPHRVRRLSLRSADSTTTSCTSPSENRLAEGWAWDAAWLGDVPGTRQSPNANCRVGRTGNGNLGSGTIGDGNFARAGAHPGVHRDLPCLRELAR